MRTSGRRRCLVWLICFLVPVVALAGDVSELPKSVRNPAADFLRRCSPLGPILEIRYDFDCDGRTDVAYADRSGCGHQGYCGYVVYLRRSARRFISVGSFGCIRHLRIRPARSGRGGIVQTFDENWMTSSHVSARGIREIGYRRNPLHYNATGEVAAFDHAMTLKPKVYSLEAFLALAAD